MYNTIYIYLTPFLWHLKNYTTGIEYFVWTPLGGRFSKDQPNIHGDVNFSAA
jgi:hypothetical protein